MKLALVSVALVLAFVVGIIIFAASSNRSSDSDGFMGECSYFNTSGARVCDPPAPVPSTYGYLGGSYRTIPASVASELGLVAGAEVSTMGNGTPVAKAGLHPASGSRTVNGDSYPIGGDVVTSVDGRRITSAAGLLNVIDANRPGKTIVIRYFRSGSRLSYTVRVNLASSW